MRLAIAAAALVCFSGGAHAQLFKCTDAAGKISYQDTPCVAGSNKGRLELKSGPTGFAPDPTLKARGQALDERLKKGELAPPAAQAQANVGPDNYHRSGERKFLPSTHSHIGEHPMNEATVLSQVGEPDRREAPGGSCPEQLRAGGVRCKDQTWIYEPNSLDPHTRTVVTFNHVGEVVKVDRQLVR